MRRWFLTLLFLCAHSGVHATDSHEQSLKVLFVGNSYTYYNNSLHNHYRALVRETFPDLEHRVRIMTISGGRLEEHKGLPAMLASEDWDRVVLQGHSRGTLDNFDGFRDAAIEHTKAIRAIGAEPLFFMTWAREGQPEMTKTVREGYESVAGELDAEIAPVGLAFAKATEERPWLRLRTWDRSHPTVAGTYLAACVFYAVLHGVSPEGIHYDAGLASADAEYLQQLAWTVVQEYTQE